MIDIEQLLAQSVSLKASDLHLSAGLPPMVRVDGDLRALGSDHLQHDPLMCALHTLMSGPQRDRFTRSMECDFSINVAGLSRFRVNAFQQMRGVSVAFRGIPERIPTLADLKAPAIFAELASRPRGLVIVSGPTGSGKSTTLAAMVEHLNQTQAQHILTIEDPVEFVYTPRRCLINQREVDGQTLSFSNALRSAMREDPNVILVGEMRDLETIRLAITAAETGHLVLGTLHTSGAAKTIDRIIDVFPAEEKEMVRSMLSESLNAVISQVLCKRKNESGRIAAFEIMVGTSGIRHLIREGKVAQMYSAIQTGSAVGMQTLDQSLSALVQQGLIDAGQASAKAQYPENFAAFTSDAWMPVAQH
jgi:twitching motility protein PilT